MGAGRTQKCTDTKHARDHPQSGRFTSSRLQGPLLPYESQGNFPQNIALRHTWHGLCLFAYVRVQTRQDNVSSTGNGAPTERSRAPFAF